MEQSKNVGGLLKQTPESRKETLKLEQEKPELEQKKPELEQENFGIMLPEIDFLPR